MKCQCVRCPDSSCLCGVFDVLHIYNNPSKIAPHNVHLHCPTSTFDFQDAQLYNLLEANRHRASSFTRKERLDALWAHKFDDVIAAFRDLVSAVEVPEIHRKDLALRTFGHVISSEFAASASVGVSEDNAAQVEETVLLNSFKTANEEFRAPYTPTPWGPRDEEEESRALEEALFLSLCEDGKASAGAEEEEARALELALFLSLCEDGKAPAEAASSSSSLNFLSARAQGSSVVVSEPSAAAGGDDELVRDATEKKNQLRLPRKKDQRWGGTPPPKERRKLMGIEDEESRELEELEESRELEGEEFKSSLLQVSDEESDGEFSQDGKASGAEPEVVSSVVVSSVVVSEQSEVVGVGNEGAILLKAFPKGKVSPLLLKIVPIPENEALQLRAMLATSGPKKELVRDAPKKKNQVRLPPKLPRKKDQRWGGTPGLPPKQNTES